MMDNLEKALSVLFKRVPACEIMEGTFASDNITSVDFVQLMRSYSNRYSDTELKNLYQYLICNFVDQYHSAELMRQGREKLDVFNLLRYYSCWILTVQDNEIVCEYSKFLHWRMITMELSEDLIASSFLAAEERETRGRKAAFEWKNVISHNNRELKGILEQGIAENHSHLKGAAPVFPLTWVSIMNNLNLHTDVLKINEIDRSRRNVNIKYKPSYREDSLSTQLLQAAYIRMILFYWIFPQRKSERERKILEGLNECLQNPQDIIWFKGNLADRIHILQNSTAYGNIPDYAIAGPLRDGADQNAMTLAFQGERWLLYKVFQKIFSGKSNIKRYQDLFYAYLVIKENFRSEIVQSNNSVGFENFSIYEQRKDLFLVDSFFKQAMVKKAVEASLFESNVVVSEARIAPRMSAAENYQYICSLDQMIDETGKYRKRFFYTVHFIKAEDKASEFDCIECRHWEKRQFYRKQAIALAVFRERYPYAANRIRGIDAANMEIGCGSEVFAQIFRFLSNHTVILEGDKKLTIPQLRMTFHVGEDYLDLISGLRAIDEAVRFLGMKCGDRLGHAIALGIDVKEWYHSKNYRIILPQQEYLDNIAWMYHLIVSFRIKNQENIKFFLQKEYEYYFQMVYKNSMNHDKLDFINEKARKYYSGTEWEHYYSKRRYDFNIENYYSAWKLRSDNPELYKEGFFANEEVVENTVKSFHYYSINRILPRRQNKRYFQEIALLYYYYHFDWDVRNEGAKPVEIKISKDFISCVELIQKELQKCIANNGISIETNPSSNYLIGTFKSYDKHPIINFYNSGLVEDPEKLKACPQLDVSINTDDAGIFSTSLENEYAYMALALEKARDKDGNFKYKKKNVYMWLDNIRKMGLHQTFLNDEEMKQAMWEWGKGEC